jgi:hypothetical protein
LWARGKHPSNPQACEEPREQNDLMLRILPGSGVVLDNNALDQATVTSEGGFNADLFFKRIDNLSQMGISKSRVLAYAAAHEMCHLLLGSGSHSPTGIMRTRWDRRDLEAINRAWLSFSPNECEQMRATIRLAQGYNDQYAVGDQAAAQSRTGRLEPIAIAAQATVYRQFVRPLSVLPASLSQTLPRNGSSSVAPLYTGCRWRSFPSNSVDRRAIPKHYQQNS